MLQEYLKLNKNILVSFAASIIISAIIAQLLSDQVDYLNTTYTTNCGLCNLFFSF